MADLKLLSLNVKGISNFKKRKTIFTWCKKRAPDVIFLQETHSVKETESLWRHQWGSDIFFSHGTTNARGVAILVKNGLDFKLEKKVFDSSGRFLLMTRH